MRSTGKDQQHRTLRIANDLAQPFEVVEDERRALVRGEPAPEADRQHVRRTRVAILQQAIEVRLAAAVAEMLIADALADRVEHPCLQVLMDRPEHVLWNVVDVVECMIAIQPMAPIRAEETIE